MTASYKRIGAVMTAFDILEYLCNQPGVTTAKQLAEALRLPYGTVMSHVATLVDRGYISQVGDSLRIGAGMAKIWALLKEELELKRAKINQALEALGTL